MLQVLRCCLAQRHGSGVWQPDSNMGWDLRPYSKITGSCFLMMRKNTSSSSVPVCVCTRACVSCLFIVLCCYYLPFCKGNSMQKLLIRLSSCFSSKITLRMSLWVVTFLWQPTMPLDVYSYLQVERDFCESTVAYFCKERWFFCIAIFCVFVLNKLLFVYKHSLLLFETDYSIFARVGPHSDLHCILWLWRHCMNIPGGFLTLCRDGSSDGRL